MDDIEELIAAGESVVRNRYENKTIVNAPQLQEHSLTDNNTQLRRCIAQFKDEPVLSQVLKEIYRDDDTNIGICEAKKRNDNDLTSNCSFDKPFPLQNESTFPYYLDASSVYRKAALSQNLELDDTSTLFNPQDGALRHVALGFNEMNGFINFPYIADSGVSSEKPEEDIKSNFLFDRPSSKLSIDSKTGIIRESTVFSLKEECASIFSLSLSMASSLNNANRLLQQLVKAQIATCKSGETLLQEISECEKNCNENQSQLNESAGRIQALLAELSDVCHTAYEQSEDMKKVHENLSLVLDLIKDLLIKNGLKHLVPTVEPRRVCSLRLLEEVKLGLMLLTGEAPTQHLLEKNEELTDVTLLKEQLLQKVQELQAELTAVKDSKRKKLINLQIQLEKITKDYSELQHQCSYLEKENIHLEELFQKQVKESEETATNLRHQMVNIQAAADKRVSEASKTDAAKDDAVKDMDAQINSLKGQMKLQEQHMLSLEEEKKELWDKFRASEKKFQEEKKSLKRQAAETSDGQITLQNKIKRLEWELEEGDKKNVDIEAVICQYQESAEKLKLEHAEELEQLIQKIDNKNDEVCEKDSKIRSLEVHLMQTDTELELERQRALSLNGETDLLSKQIDRLQEKMKKVMNICPRDVRIMSGLNLTTEREGQPSPASYSKIEKLLEDSQMREETLQKLLTQKDEELKALQTSISKEISNKNEELAKLSDSVEMLEGEMKDIISSLNVSANIYDSSQRTKEFLSSRTKHIESLQQEVLRLSLDGSSCLEGQSDAVEDLKSQLADAKKALRTAREEARKERIESAKLKQQLALMQIDLESAKEASRSPSVRQRSSLGSLTISDVQAEGLKAYESSISGEHNLDVTK